MHKILTFIIVFISCSLSAQFAHEPVYPALQGNTLKQALVNDYKTNTVLTYSQARDTFMKNMDAVNNVLECVYSGYQVTLNPNEDPTTDAFAKGINTEHTYPRSKGAQEGTNAYSDMHHLFPTKENVNSARGSLPFTEIIDTQTDKWFLEDNVRNTIPTSNIDGYAELKENEGFEPREQHKGDVARAYFYFYTMYQNQADNAAPNFFESQRETLCDWHFQDAVDEKEWNRNLMIASYQDDKVNPFILDCRLARLYCGDIEGYCISVSTNSTSVESIESYPNPVSDRLVVINSGNRYSRFQISTANGQIVQSGFTQLHTDELIIDVSTLMKGFYIIAFSDDKDRTQAISRFIKI